MYLFIYFRCGDRLLAVDGQTLENIPHHMAVKMLKQTSTRVVLEVVSWMGTELWMNSTFQEIEKKYLMKLDLNFLNNQTLDIEDNIQT